MLRIGVIMERQDEISQSVDIAAPIERVWAALTQADQIAQWFGDSATVDFRVGGKMKFGWSHYDDAVAHAVIERIEPTTAFAYRWWMASDDEASATLVTFTLSNNGDTTKVTVVESRLASLPLEAAKKIIEENSEGWIEELDELLTYVEGS